MKKLFLFLLIASFIILACLEPERDNPYDPKNPNNAYLGGIIYGFDDLPIQDAIVKLVRDTTIIREVSSDNNGWYEFDRVEPNVYRLVAEAGYYTPIHIHPVDITTGSYNDSFDLYFQEIYFDFDDEAVGIHEPRGFTIISGIWQVRQDPLQPGEHSIPNVYNGVMITPSMNDFVIAAFRDPVKDFWLDVKIKILDTFTGNRETGVVLRYQDEYNFYLLVLRPDEMTLYKIQGGNVYELATNEDINFSPDVWYFISADLHDDDIQIFLNQNPVLQSSDNAFLQGVIGLYVKTGDEPDTASVYFDDIGIWP